MHSYILKWKVPDGIHVARGLTTIPIPAPAPTGTCSNCLHCHGHVLCLDPQAWRANGIDSRESGPLSASGVGLTQGREGPLHSAGQKSVWLPHSEDAENCRSARASDGGRVFVLNNVLKWLFSLLTHPGH